MRYFGLMMMVAMAATTAGCAITKHIAGTDQCMAPSDSEAKITKRVWM